MRSVIPARAHGQAAACPCHPRQVFYTAIHSRFQERAAGAAGVLQAKANHGTLYRQLKATLDEAIALKFQGMDHDRTRDVHGDHGRIETRRLWCTPDIQWVPDRRAWAGLRSVACVECRRWVDGRASVERRYYLSSLDGRDAAAMLHAVRGHWGIENQLHWSLDVTFGEDGSRVRKENAAENLSRVRRLALGLLRRETTFRAGLKRKRLRCALDHAYLMKVLDT